jgi:uncharacterized protein YecE (DUF72 family)
VATLRLGTSGWIYKHWKGIFYPEKVPQRSWLDFYQRHFDTVEINFTFYRLPERSVFESWHDRSPPGFAYAVKGSRFLTHVRRLREPEEGVGRIAERLEGLGDRVGPLLWQLPPDFVRDDERLARFLACLPERWQHTVEFRHESWLDETIFTMLERHGVALCIPDSPRLPKALRLTAPWTYVRFHGDGPGGNYTPEMLDRWADFLRGVLASGADAWVYFNNDWYGYALWNARDLSARLGLAQPALIQPRLAETA